MPAILITIDPKSVQRHVDVEVADTTFRRGDRALGCMKRDEVPVTVAQYETMKKLVNRDGIHLAMDESGQLSVIQQP